MRAQGRPARHEILESTATVRLSKAAELKASRLGKGRRTPGDQDVGLCKEWEHGLPEGSGAARFGEGIPAWPLEARRAPWAQLEVPLCDLAGPGNLILPHDYISFYLQTVASSSRAYPATCFTREAIHNATIARLALRSPGSHRQLLPGLAERSSTDKLPHIPSLNTSPVPQRHHCTHRTSFENLLALSRSPLSHHVHDVVYDVRLLCSIPDIKMAFEANEFRLVGANVDVSRKKIFALLDDYEKQALDSIESTEVKLMHMLQIFPGLPNLEHITITSGSLCELPYFYRKLKESLFITSDYYFETSNHSGHEARSVLLCLGGLSLDLTSLSFVGIDWSEIVLYSELRTPARYLTMLQRVFRDLPKETLSLSMFLFLYTNEQENLGAAIEDLMPVCATVLHKVQRLTLSLATTRSERQLFMPTGPSWPLSRASRCAWLHWVVQCLQSIGQVGPKGLRRLELSSLVLDPADLDFILSGCQDTLTGMSMGDLRLYTASDDPASNAHVNVEESCWVSTLDTIPKHMRHLDVVNLFGRFYNGGSQDWIMNARNKGSLRSDVEGWLVSGGMCPLESERIEGGFQGTRAGDASFKIFRRTLDDGEVYYDFPPTSENELHGA